MRSSIPEGRTGQLKAKQFPRKESPIIAGLWAENWQSQYLAVTVSQTLQIVKVSDNTANTANVSDTIFDDNHALEWSIILTDKGFKKKEGTPQNFKICPKGRWNERMVIETLFSLWVRICNAKKILPLLSRRVQSQNGLPWSHFLTSFLT